MLDYNESPLFLQLNPSGAMTSKELPITVYETFVEGVTEGQPRNTFVKSNYKIEISEAERIAVDHVARAANEGSGDGSSCKFLFY
jgi:COP9 signalosome complex subunit 6